MAATDRVSLWDATATEPDFEAPLQANARADVVVVGGGFTGLSTALHCAERGLSALVLEAVRIGYGGSGRNVGLVNAGVWYPPAKVRDSLGPTFGPRFVERFGAAPSYVFSLIERHQIRCEVTKTGTIHAAQGASGLEDLRARHREWTRLGAPVDLLGHDDVSEATGTRTFRGGLLDHRAGTINPMGYCRGLARAARAAGARIATGVRATRLLRDGDDWVVETNQGAARARTVVLGTNAYTDTLWPGLSQTYTPIHYFQLATAPLGDAVATILPGRQGLWDNGRIMVSLRRDASNRLLIGSMGRIFGSATEGLSRRWAAKKLAKLFPDLGPVDFEEAWHGQIAMTPDHLPRMHQLAPDLYTPIGYNGRGITSGTLFGKAMAGLLAGDDPADLPLPMSDPARVPAAGLKARLYQTAFTANQVLGSL